MACVGETALERYCVGLLGPGVRRGDMGVRRRDMGVRRGDMGVRRGDIGSSGETLRAPGDMADDGDAKGAAPFGAAPLFLALSSD